MKNKTCPNCNKESWSAGAVPWICPYCQKLIKETEEVKEIGGK